MDTLVTTKRTPLPWGYLWALLAPLTGTVLLSPFHNIIGLSNAALLYMLCVVVVAIRFGRGPAVFTSLIGSLSFAYVFVPPYFSLAITEINYLLTALIMLAVALLVGHLTARLKQHRDYALKKSRENAILYDLAQELAGTSGRLAVVDAANRFFSRLLDARRTHLHFPTDYRDSEPEPLSATTPATASTVPPALLRLCAERREFLSRPTAPGESVVLLPLANQNETLGVLSFEVAGPALGNADALKFVETAASVLAVALARSELAERMHLAEVKHTSESLRSSILAALSHDLRTPVTALVGMADTIALGKLSPERQRYMLDGIRTQAMSINQQMSKLLDMAKLSAGKLELRTEWQPIDEVLGATLQLIKAQWKDREITVDLPAALPPIRIDAVLIERVLWNLLENAIKYAPADSPIEITVRHSGHELELAVADAGPGLSAAQQENVFELFQRGRSESDIPGLGLGLAIARTIMTAHGGRITAHNRSGGGACFRVHFPLEQAPALPEADADREKEQKGTGKSA